MLNTYGVQAQEVEPAIVTDRPDFTESSLVVPRGSLQLESGFTYQKEKDGSSNVNLPEVLLRYGLSARTELRFGGPNYNFARASGTRTSGLDDFYIGFKHQLRPTDAKVGLSLIPAITVPAGGNNFSSGRVDPEIKFTAATELSEKTALSGMLAMYWPTEDDGTGKRRNRLSQFTLSVAQVLDDRWSVFVEYDLESPQRGRTAHIGHSGLVYALSPKSQIDIRGGAGLNGAGPDYFFGGGYSVRF